VLLSGELDRNRNKVLNRNWLSRQTSQNRSRSKDDASICSKGSRARVGIDRQKEPSKCEKSVGGANGGLKHKKKTTERKKNSTLESAKSGRRDPKSSITSDQQSSGLMRACTAKKLEESHHGTQQGYKAGDRSMEEMIHGRSQEVLESPGLWESSIGRTHSEKSGKGEVESTVKGGYRDQESANNPRTRF